MEPNKEQKGSFPQQQKQGVQREQSGIGADKKDLETHTQSESSKKPEYQAPLKQSNDQMKQL